MNRPLRPDTPLIIRAALGLLPFAFAAPFIGGFVSDHTPGDDTRILGAFFEWVLAGIGAGALGIVCTIVGAWRGPRSALTMVAVVLAALLCAAAVIAAAWLS